MKKEYTIDDFKANTYAYKPIKEDGYISYSEGGYSINHSGILTRLIQEAGRFCERFASDLFLDWKSVEKWIENAERGDSTVYLFGFRRDGVDGNSFIMSRYNGGGYAYPEKEYRSMWRLDIETNGDKIEMNLGRVF